MKISTSLSATIATLALVGTVNAATPPDSMASFSDCMAWAESHQGTEVFIPASERCYSLKDCNTNHSGNGQEYQDCSFIVEETFRSKMAVVEGTGVEKVNTLTAVGTQPANSHYETDPTRKGFIESAQE
jgi:hypothetical protein